MQHNKAHHSQPAAAGTSNAIAFFRPCALRYMLGAKLKYIAIIVMFSFLNYAHGNECSEQLFKQRQEIENKYKTEITLTKQFSYITSISMFRKAAFKDGAINLIHEIDRDLYLRIAEVVVFAKNKPEAELVNVNFAIEALVKDSEYYPLTWSQESKDDLDKLRSR